MNQNLLQSQDPRSYNPACSPDGFPLWEGQMETGPGHRPPPFAKLEQALSALSGEFLLSNRTRFRIFVTGRPKALDNCVREQVYWIAREAVRNACRHAGATNIEAEIEYSSHKFRVVVRDNGSGIRPEVLLQKSHWGLLEMRERAAQIGAQMRVWSRAGAGTEVEICVPGHIAQASPFPA